jgi:DNA-binding MarR family transcriptional regulator
MKFEVKIFDHEQVAGHTGGVPPEHEGNAPAACEPAASWGPAPLLPRFPGEAPAGGEASLPRDVSAPRLLRFPEDLPLHALLLTATRLMGAYGEWTVHKAGLAGRGPHEGRVSLSGLGVLRVLLAENGLKASEVADRAWSNPGTLTSVVNTLVKDGFVERRPDDADRRVVRLYITGPGRDVVTYYVTQAAPMWRRAFDFVGDADEAVVRRFFIDMITHLSRLLDEERGK